MSGWICGPFDYSRDRLDEEKSGEEERERNSLSTEISFFFCLVLFPAEEK